MKAQQEMTLEEALQLLAQSRQIHWSFPTSQGRPVKWDAPEDWVREIVGKKQAIVEAARFLVDHGEYDMAMELAANAWRLWILSRDISC